MGLRRPLKANTSLGDVRASICSVGYPEPKRQKDDLLQKNAKCKT